MVYSGQQQFLISAAKKYTNLGYTIGLSKDKTLIKTFSGYESDINFDGISIILDGLVCVDIDSSDIDLGWHYLPPTLKERSPRGWHLFYRLDLINYSDYEFHSKIKWDRCSHSSVDLLVKESIQRKTKDGKLWSAHALVSPSVGYRRVYHDEMPYKNDVAIAPDWLMEAISNNLIKKNKSGTTTLGCIDWSKKDSIY